MKFYMSTNNKLSNSNGFILAFTGHCLLLLL